MRTSKARISGKKFFQDGLTKLKVLHDLKPLPASAIATYMLFHLECDDLGRIRANTFSLSKLSEPTKIPYTTIHTGRNVLFERDLLREVIIGNEPYYEIVGYNEWNSPEINAQLGNNSSLNYFKIPFKLFTSPSLKALVSSRDASGLIMLLDLFNTFTRGMNMYGSEDTTRTMKTLKEKMKKTAKSIRDWVVLVKDLFIFEAEETTERKPDFSRLTTRKKNNPIQIVIKKFSIKMNPDLVYELEDTYNTEMIESSVRKEVAFKLPAENIKHSSKDLKDIVRVFKEEVISSLKYYNDSILTRNQIMLHVFNTTFDQLIEYYKDKKMNDPKQQIKSLGAFMRNGLLKKLHHLATTPNRFSGTLHDAVVSYHHEKKEYPKFYHPKYASKN